MTIRKYLVLGIVASTVLLSQGVAGTAPRLAHAAVSARQLIDGTLQPGFATTAPTTLQILTTYHGLVTVSVAPTTPIVRRYNGISALDELSPGDHVYATGVMSGGNTFVATAIKDVTIQVGFSHNLGVITAISPDGTQLTVRVLADSRYKGQNPFVVGELITMRVTPGMTITLADGATGTVKDDLSPGVVIASLGTFNRNSHNFMSVRMRVVTPTAGQTTEVSGILQAGFGTTVPTTLTLRTRYHGLITVGLTAGTKLVRRYNGASSLAEFTAGDALSVVGTYQGGTSYSAAGVKDVSIQYAYTLMIGQIATVNGTTLTATVLRNDRAHPYNDPFVAGERVTLNVGAGTVVTLAGGAAGSPSSVQPGMRVAALGVFDRGARAFTSVARIRILP